MGGTQTGASEWGGNELNQRLCWKVAMHMLSRSLPSTLVMPRRCSELTSGRRRETPASHGFLVTPCCIWANYTGYLSPTDYAGSYTLIKGKRPPAPSLPGPWTLKSTQPHLT